MSTRLASKPSIGTEYSLALLEPLFHIAQFADALLESLASRLSPAVPILMPW